MTDCNRALTPMVPGVRLTKDGPSFAPAGKDDEPVDATVYRELVGSLLYATTCTRPDIAVAVREGGTVHVQPNQAPLDCRQACAALPQGHCRCWVDLLRQCIGNCAGSIHRFGDWAADEDTRRSTTGYAFVLGGAAVKWKSKRQM